MQGGGSDFFGKHSRFNQNGTGRRRTGNNTNIGYELGHHASYRGFAGTAIETAKEQKNRTQNSHQMVTLFSYTSQNKKHDMAAPRLFFKVIT